MATVKQPTINDFFKACDELNEELSFYKNNINSSRRQLADRVEYHFNSDEDYEGYYFDQNITIRLDNFPSIFRRLELFIFKHKETFLMSTILQFYRKNITILDSCRKKGYYFDPIFNLQSDTVVTNAINNLNINIKTATNLSEFCNYITSSENIIENGIFMKTINFYESLAKNEREMLEEDSTFNLREDKKIINNLHLFLETLSNADDISLGGRNKKSHRHKRVTRRRKQKTTHRRKQKTTHRRKRRAH